MMRMKALKYVPGSLALVFATALGINGCSAAKDLENASKGCDGLDVTLQAQAVLKGYADAAAKLRTRALEVEAKFLAVCNAMNADLHLDTSKTTAAEACGVLKARIDQAAQAGGVVTMEISANCSVDVNAQASCDAACDAKANCDVMASCTGGQFVVACMGSCSGTCDVTAPSFDCTGTCEGTCTASAAVACSGSCT